MKIGTMSRLREGGLDCIFDRIAAMDLHYTQLSCWDAGLYTEGNGARVVEQSLRTGVKVCALWTGYSQPVVWNFEQGPVTLGLVPPEYRERRIAELMKGADFAKSIGAPAIITHCGFLPENMTDANYAPVRDAIAEVAGYCDSLGLGFWFETGQETPVTLLRFIEDIGLPNLGINLDPANLVMYGKGSPCDAMDVFGRHVRNLHVKDGRPPVDGRHLGPEVKAGCGSVDFPRLVKRLRETGFDGEFIIEREIGESEEQARDIRETALALERWWNAE